MITRRVKSFMVAVVLGAVSVAVILLPHARDAAWLQIAVLLGLGLVAANMTVQLPFSVSISLGFAVLFAALLYAGPLAAGLVGAVSAFSLQEIREGKPLLLMVGNAGQLALSGMLAGLVYVAVGGAPLQEGLPLSASVFGGLVAPVLSMSGFFAVNVALVSAGVALKTGMSVKDTLQVLNLGSYWVSLVVLALLGLVMGYLLALGSWAGLLLLVLPFALARQTFRVYLELSEAYTTTVRSLVAAIEAKDPYTRGHSERVAVLSRALAERMNRPVAEVELVERAALLHDVGKIGVSIATLTSPSPLTAEEYREVRNHPAIGSSLLESVEFLSDTVPIVRHHHEHMDGAGYPDGLSGDEIPYLSRMLATVDAYDAMTSDRAYRPAMSDNEAIAEMIRVAGQQLDPSVVNALAALLLERQRSGEQSA